MDSDHRQILEKWPGIQSIVSENGRLSVLDYATAFFENTARPLQSAGDLIEVVRDYATRLLGADYGVALERYLEEIPVVLTANHHGVNYKAMTMQGELLYALPAIFGRIGKAAPVLPVLACGIVPLSNCAFPRGIALSREVPVSDGGNGKKTSFLKIPILPSRKSAFQVSIAPPIESGHLERARKTIESHFQRGELLESEHGILLDLLGDEYGRPEVLAQRNYSDQAVILGSRIWKRIFSAEVRGGVPEMAHLEMERIVGELIARDLERPDSLLYTIFFDPLLREMVLRNLDGVMGCWDLGKLTGLHRDNDPRHHLSEAYRGCGTTFFFFTDHHGRRVPALLESGGTSSVLVGISPGSRISQPFTAESVAAGLKSGKLLPGLFASFTTLALARGIRCIGGFMQVDYLPAMQRGVTRSLADRGLGEWVEPIAAVQSANFLTGMNVVMAGYPDGSSSPAGAIELIASGGLTAADLERIGRIPVSDANLSGLIEFHAELAGDDDGYSGVVAAMPESGRQALRERLLGKELQAPGSSEESYASMYIRQQ